MLSDIKLFDMSMFDFDTTFASTNIFNTLRRLPVLLISLGITEFKSLLAKFRVALMS